MFKLLEDFCDELYYETRCVSSSKRSNINVKNVFFVLFAKARTILKLIVILSREKQFPAIPALLRSLLEIYIQMKWMADKNTIELATRYADLSNVIRMRAYLRGKANWQQYVSTSSDQQFLELYQENTTIAKRYGYPDIMEVRNWRPKKDNKRYNISDMAKEVSLNYEYDVVYNVLCETTHIGPGSDLDYEVIPEGQGLIPRKPTEPVELSLAASYFLNIYTMTNQAMGQNFRDVTFHKLKFEQLRNKIFTGHTDN